MPIPFALLVGLSLGAGLAWVAAPELARSDGPVAASRSFAVIVGFAALLWMPVLTYFVAFHGDWAYLYMVPWRRVPSAIDLGLIVLAGAALVGGFWLSVRPLRARHGGPVVALVVGPAALAMAGVIACARRLAISATYAQYHGDFGTDPIGTSALGKAVLVMGALLALGVAWTVRSLLVMSAEDKS